MLIFMLVVLAQGAPPDGFFHYADHLQRIESVDYEYELYALEPNGLFDSEWRDTRLIRGSKIASGSGRVEPNTNQYFIDEVRLIGQDELRHRTARSEGVWHLLNYESKTCTVEADFRFIEFFYAAAFGESIEQGIDHSVLSQAIADERYRSLSPIGDDGILIAGLGAQPEQKSWLDVEIYFSPEHQWMIETVAVFGVRGGEESRGLQTSLHCRDFVEIDGVSIPTRVARVYHESVPGGQVFEILPASIRVNQESTEPVVPTMPEDFTYINKITNDFREPFENGISQLEEVDEAYPPLQITRNRKPLGYKTLLPWLVGSLGIAVVVWFVLRIRGGAAVIAFALTLAATSSQGHAAQEHTSSLTCTEKRDSEHHRIQFGVDAESGSAEKVFRFKNESNGVIRLGDVETTCGCSQAVWADQLIEPGATTTLKVVATRPSDATAKMIGVTTSILGAEGKKTDEHRFLIELFVDADWALVSKTMAIEGRFGELGTGFFLISANEEKKPKLFFPDKSLEILSMEPWGANEKLLNVQVRTINVLDDEKPNDRSIQIANVADPDYLLQLQTTFVVRWPVEVAPKFCTLRFNEPKQLTVTPDPAWQVQSARVTDEGFIDCDLSPADKAGVRTITLKCTEELEANRRGEIEIEISKKGNAGESLIRRIPVLVFKKS